MRAEGKCTESSTITVLGTPLGALLFAGVGEVAGKAEIPSLGLK